MKNFFNFLGMKSQKTLALPVLAKSLAPATAVVNVTTTTEIVYPDSVQKDLWAVMTPKQKAIVQPVFRRLKKHTQEVLATALLDYVTCGRDPRFSDVVLGGLFLYFKNYFEPASVNPVRN